jgi:hypothetical protein
MGNSQQPTAWERTLQTHTLNFPSDNQPRFRHEQWRKVFENQVSKSLLNAFIAADDPLFSMPLGENMEEWKVWLSREGVWERYRTLGQVAVLEGEELEVCCFSVTTSFGSDRFCLFMRALVLLTFSLCRKLARSSTMLSMVMMWRRMKRVRSLCMGLRTLTGLLRSLRRGRRRFLRLLGRGLRGRRMLLRTN